MNQSRCTDTSIGIEKSSNQREHLQKYKCRIKLVLLLKKLTVHEQRVKNYTVFKETPST